MARRDLSLSLRDYPPATVGQTGLDWLFQTHWITYEVHQLAVAALALRDAIADARTAYPAWPAGTDGTMMHNGVEITHAEWLGP